MYAAEINQELHKFIPRLHTLVSKPPKITFDIQCPEHILKTIVDFFQTFIDSSGGFMNLVMLLIDKVLYINKDIRPN